MHNFNHDASAEQVLQLSMQPLQTFPFSLYKHSNDVCQQSVQLVEHAVHAAAATKKPSRHARQVSFSSHLIQLALVQARHLVLSAS